MNDQLQGPRYRVGPYVTVCQYALIALASHPGVWAPGLKTAVSCLSLPALGLRTFGPLFIHQSSLIEHTTSVFPSGDRCFNLPMVQREALSSQHGLVEGSSQGFFEKSKDAARELGGES